MKAIINAAIISGIFLVFTPLLQAAETADHSASKDSNVSLTGLTKAPKKEPFIREKTIASYTVTFKVIKVAPGMEGHGGSHNLMVKVEKDGSAQILPSIVAKVLIKGGTSVTKTLFKRDDWYMNGFDLGIPNKYQLNVLFRTSSTRTKYTTNVWYEVKEDK